MRIPIITCNAIIFDNYRLDWSSNMIVDSAQFT